MSSLSFSNSTSNNKRARIDEEIAKYSCADCNMPFEKYKDLQNHKRKHKKFQVEENQTANNSSDTESSGSESVSAECDSSDFTLTDGNPIETGKFHIIL